jgi:hypothetical protein
MAEPACQLVAEAVASGPGEGTAACGNDHFSGEKAAVAMGDKKSCLICRLDGGDSMIRPKDNAEASAPGQESGQDRVSSIGDRKEFTWWLSFEGDPQ